MTSGKRPTEGLNRIVSLAPSVSSILCALGLNRRLVGVTKWCADVAPVGELARLGDCWSVNVADLRRLTPDLVIGSVPYKTEVIGRLLREGFTFLAMNPASLGDVYSDILLLGRLLGAEDNAHRIIRTMRAEFAAVKKCARRARFRPRVYCESWSNPLMASPRWVEEMVEIAGGRFVPAGGGRKVTSDEVIAADPEIIILAWAATGDRANPKRVFDRPGWERITAVREKRVYVIRDEKLNTPSPILRDGLRELARLIHPDLFVHVGESSSDKGTPDVRRKALARTHRWPAQHAAN